MWQASQVIFIFFCKATQNVRSKPKPRKYGLRTEHRHMHGQDWAQIGHERTGHGRARHRWTGHGLGTGTGLSMGTGGLGTGGLCPNVTGTH
jgi:hypothetical protein